MTNSYQLPVMMYIHGFMSGANGAKQRQLQKRFKGRYEVIAPELDADPDSSLAVINKLVKERRPDIIVGTSLGGFITLMCESDDDTQLVVVNPCMTPQTQIDRWKDEPQTYFCKRLDGVQTYTLTQETLDKYPAYDAVTTAKAKRDRIYALCSTADELLGESHIETLRPILSGGHLTISDDFGHQCKGAGLECLYDILEILHTEKALMDECREWALRESEVEPVEALRLLTECYMDNCGISMTARTLAFDAGEHWLKRLHNSRHPLAAIAGKGTFTEFMPYINNVYCDNRERYDEFDICGDIDRPCALDAARDLLACHDEEAFKIAFATGFLKVEQYYNGI